MYTYNLRVKGFEHRTEKMQNLSSYVIFNALLKGVKIKIDNLKYVIVDFNDFSIPGFDGFIFSTSA